MDYSLPGSSGHGIFPARTLEWVAISFSRGSSWPRDSTCISCTAVVSYISYIASRFFTTELPGKPMWKTAGGFSKHWKQNYHMIQQFHFWLYTERKLNHCKRDICNPMFTAALFAVAKTWKQTTCPLMDDWIKKMWCVYNGILLSHKRKKPCHLQQNW